MNTLTVKPTPTPVVDTKAWENNIHSALEACKRHLKKLSWFFERHPGFVEKNAWDKNIGIEVRRMRY